ncbi:MAG: carotenoid oxygenase family protein [Halobacterium sp.]
MADYRIGFESADTEHDAVGLRVEGDLPDWLDGRLLRNGPGKFETGDGERFAHWFDGLAYLRAFAFSDGGVELTTRFLRTDEYRAVVEEGSLAAGQFGTQAGGTLLSRLKDAILPASTDNANVNVLCAGGDFVALTEVPTQVAFDPETLATRGEWAFDDDLDAHMACAHPVTDPDSGDTFNVYVQFGRNTDYVLTRIPAGATHREVVGSVSLSKPVYVHSFAVTPDHAVLAACPLVIDVWGLLRPGGHDNFLDALDWQPGRPTRFFVLSRATGDVVAESTAPAFFTFHHANAFRRGDSLVLDLVAFEDASVVDDLSLADLQSGSVRTLDGDLRRYTVPLDGGRASHETLAEGGLSLPRFDERRRGQESRYVYATRAGGEDGAPNHLVRVDCERGAERVWREDGTFCGEPVFVPEPDGSEADGVVLSVVLDADREQSFLLVLDADSFEERARAWAPDVLPFDFHGQYYADA